MDFPCISANVIYFSHLPIDFGAFSGYQRCTDVGTIIPTVSSKVTRSFFWSSLGALEKQARRALVVSRKHTIDLFVGLFV